MKQDRRSLDDMIEQLAGMDGADRTEVLDRLGPALHRRLAPYLDGAPPLAGVSPALASLIEDIGKNRPVADLTETAVDALRKAATSIDRRSSEAPPAASGPFTKLVSFLRGGGL